MAIWRKPDRATSSRSMWAKWEWHPLYQRCLKRSSRLRGNSRKLAHVRLEQRPRLRSYGLFPVRVVRTEA
jgi:hypothetical protein